MKSYKPITMGAIAFSLLVGGTAQRINKKAGTTAYQFLRSTPKNADAGGIERSCENQKCVDERIHYQYLIITPIKKPRHARQNFQIPNPIWFVFCLEDFDFFVTICVSHAGSYTILKVTSCENSWVDFPLKFKYSLKFATKL